MAQHKQGVREVRVVFETPNHNFSRTDIHIMDRITNALAQVMNTNIGVAFYDEHGHRLRRVEFGEPTAAMKQTMDDELGTEEVVA